MSRSETSDSKRSLRKRQREMWLRQKSKPRRGWKRNRRRWTVTRLASWMQSRLDAGSSAEDVARMVKDELGLRPEEIRTWIIRRTTLLTAKA